MHLRILKLLDTHCHHDEVACTSKVKVTLRGQNGYCLIGLPIGRSEAIFCVKVLFWGYLSSSVIVLVTLIYVPGFPYVIYHMCSEQIYKFLILLLNIFPDFLD